MATVIDFRKLGEDLAGASLVGFRGLRAKGPSPKSGQSKRGIKQDVKASNARIGIIKGDARTSMAKAGTKPIKAASAKAGPKPIKASIAMAGVIKNGVGPCE